MGFKSLPHDRENLLMLFSSNEDSSSASYDDALNDDAFIKFYQDLQRFL